ncbi:hypothetical protein DAPPUDRAFT_105759 [Daphnia pulex]|uniref:Uncharacterized protein n=1 Tax=Daphnia pulex TaxID=6669 RepID=E9GRR0_DAPPU|nr:hypothetical protein DAPPUDRAFT_105759 [Daphnia pulex]|eukprot:EFX77816.1 hypothetical protein DAPPUDRAFT_105759 [Daphnia pulex]
MDIEINLVETLKAGDKVIAHLIKKVEAAKNAKTLLAQATHCREILYVLRDYSPTYKRCGPKFLLAKFSMDWERGNDLGGWEYGNSKSRILQLVARNNIDLSMRETSWPRQNRTVFRCSLYIPDAFEVSWVEAMATWPLQNLNVFTALFVEVYKKTKEKNVHCFVSQKANSKNVIIFFNTVQGLQPSLRKPLQTLNGQNPRVLGKKKSLQITTTVQHTTKDNENVVPINHCSTNSNIGCATNVMLNQPQTECLREDRRNGSCMVIEETNDNAVIYSLTKDNDVVDAINHSHHGCGSNPLCLNIQESECSVESLCMDIQETNDTALVNETITTDTSPVYSPTEDLVTVVTSSQSSTLPDLGCVLNPLSLNAQE